MKGICETFTLPSLFTLFLLSFQLEQVTAYPFHFILKQNDWCIIQRPFLMGSQSCILYPSVSSDDKHQKLWGNHPRWWLWQGKGKFAPKWWIDSDCVSYIRWSPVSAGFSKRIIDFLPQCLRPTTCKSYVRDQREFISWDGQKQNSDSFKENWISNYWFLRNKINRIFASYPVKKLRLLGRMETALCYNICLKMSCWFLLQNLHSHLILFLFIITYELFFYRKKNYP